MLYCKLLCELLGIVLDCHKNLELTNTQQYLQHYLHRFAEARVASSSKPEI